ncbi:hypothetical protein C0992_001816 [Termitomyces sp. T32_za158]|nr:hypothetical protein C0992_001816 [Termitomyces sp. T32_za158]
MRLTDSDHNSLSASPDFSALAGPSTDHSNGHSNGFTKSSANGTGNGVLSKNRKAIARLSLPGTTLYDDMHVDREEYVRLVIQSLRDVGYIESAATLEAESGYVMEEAEVTDFRQCILDGLWSKAEAALIRLGVSEGDGLWEARFLISQQKYLELLEAKKITSALHVLRHELAPLDVDSEQLHTLSRRGHSDEVWNLEWSHDGLQLATASKDKTAIIWKLSYDMELLRTRWEARLILKDHPYPVGCLAWSKDDSVLLTSTENLIKMWNAKTGVCTKTLETHKETVTALAWLPDGTGFISGGLDRNIIHWDVEGNIHDKWVESSIRITDLAVSPDFSRLVSVGMQHLPIGNINEGITGREVQSGDAAAAGAAAARASENRMIIYDLTTKQVESSIRLEGELTSVKVSRDSRFALINHAPDEIHLWDLDAGQLSRKYTGQRQGRHVIRSCFGGYDGNFVVSGSEDSNVYIWHRDYGALLENLAGHGEGSVNSVAWNPTNHCMFASCSDDHTIRIWEASPELMFEKSLSLPQSSPTENGNGENGKGKTRQQWDTDGVEIGL